MLKLLLTCEHGGNSIPFAYQSYFHGQKHVINSHRGYDIGALELFNELEDLADTKFYSETSRLLVELNRSLHHKHLFSEFTKDLLDQEKNDILKHYYYPYRDKVEQMIQDLVRAGRKVLHIAIHSFTPIMNGEIRKADVGLLYDPKRRCEQSFSRDWRQKLLEQDAGLLVRNNYPYLGIADGFPTHLRKIFNENEYMGIELEVNQKFAEGDPERWNSFKQSVRASLEDTLQKYRPNTREEQAA